MYILKLAAEIVGIVRASNLNMDEQWAAWQVATIVAEAEGEPMRLPRGQSATPGACGAAEFAPHPDPLLVWRKVCHRALRW